MTDAGPLWTVLELEGATGGEWLRRPGAGWAPSAVRSTALGDIVPSWLGGSIIFVTSEQRLERWFAHEAAPGVEPAGCVVVGRELAASPALPRHRAVLVVDDTTAALRALAVRARERLWGRVIVVTGTVGKTTTRAMLVHMLGRAGSVLTNAGNGRFRAHVFQHMASARPDADYVVLEAGLGGAPNSFSDVSAVVRPHVVLLTQVEVAHLDALAGRPRTREEALLAVARQKVQLADALIDGGAVVVNRDIAVYDEVAAMLRGRRVVTFGDGGDADHRLLEVEPRGTGTRVRADASGEELAYALALPGRFMALNALGAVAAAAEAGVEPAEAAEALAEFEAVPGRARVVSLRIGTARFTLIDDSYNATPFTMRSTLELLEQIQPGPGGRRIAVLGDMANLGDDSVAAHAELAGEAAARGVDRVYTLGAEARHLHDALAPDTAAGHFDDRRALLEALLADVRDGDVMTVKASVAARFDRIVHELEARGGLAPTQPDPAPVGLLSAAAAEGLGSEALVAQRHERLPRGAWVYVTDGAGGGSLLAGEDVEQLADGIVEGAWDRPFEEGRPDRAEHLFGSGLLRGEDGALTILTPKHSLEAVYVIENKTTGRAAVANSLAIGCAMADVRVPPDPEVWHRFQAVAGGFYKAPTCMCDTDELTVHKLVYYDYTLRPDGSARRDALPPAPAFSRYGEYRQAVASVLAAVAANAAHPARRRRYAPLTTVSAGYDSAACAALAREVGCTQAVTMRTARRGEIDTGRPVGEALGLEVIERERLDFPEAAERTTITETRHKQLACVFLATWGGGDDVFFTAFEDVLPGTLLFTGFHGDKVWDPNVKPSTDGKRGDVSGSSLGEYRARLGFLNLPVPFIHIRSQPAVREIGRAPEMAPWRVGGAYDRPVPRRIAEEAGVPRAAFGQRKMATCVIFDNLYALSFYSLAVMRKLYGDALTEPSRL
ncbi:MAG TPA: Mur ligase family protein [Solirubrobacteraceae bacterium]